MPILKYSTSSTASVAQAAVPSEAVNAICWLIDKWYNSPEMIGKVSDDWKQDYYDVIAPLVWNALV